MAAGPGQGETATQPLLFLDNIPLTQINLMYFFFLYFMLIFLTILLMSLSTF